MLHTEPELRTYHFPLQFHVGRLQKFIQSTTILFMHTLKNHPKIKYLSTFAIYL